MGDKSEQIERHVDRQRRELLDNMVELATEQPAMWPASHPDVPEDPGMSRRPLEDSGNTQGERAASATWENLKEALLAVAVTKASSAVELLLPGFCEEYKKAGAGTGGRSEILRAAVRSTPLRARNPL